MGHPLKWDRGRFSKEQKIHLSGTGRTKNLGVGYFGGNLSKKTMKTEDKVKRKAKRRRKIERTIKNDDFRLIS